MHMIFIHRVLFVEKKEYEQIRVRVCDHVYVLVRVSVCIQDPPNGALECKVDGVATTTVVTITAPVMMTDETGVTTLTYDAELVSMTRGGPTAANMTAAAEDVAEEVVVCDENSGVSLFIDDAPAAPSCPSPMLDSSQLPPELLPQCYPGPTPTGGCASGWTVESGGIPVPYCVPS